MAQGWSRKAGVWESAKPLYGRELRCSGSAQVWRAFGTPPSTRRVEPVMKAAASDSKKHTAAATSASVPRRCIGTLRSSALMRARTAASELSSTLEAIPPGATALTRTPAAAHSQAAVSVNDNMPARAGPEWPIPGMPPHMSAMMLTMAPPCISIPYVKHSRAIRKPPVRLLRSTASQPLRLMARKGAGNCPPALLNRPSMRPCRASTAPTVSRTASSSRMSQTWVLTCSAASGAAAAISACTAWSLAPVRPPSPNRAPRLANSCAAPPPTPPRPGGGRGGGAPRQRQPGAEAGQLVRGAAADAAAPAGDDDHLALEEPGSKDGTVMHAGLLYFLY